MNNKELVQVISQEDFPKRLKAFCSENQNLPLAVFYDTFVSENYDPRKTITDVSAQVFGRPGLMKKVTFDEKFLKEMDEQIAYLKALPQQLIEIRGGMCCDGYDHVMLFAERFAQSSGKHVIAMLAEKNRITEESLGSRKLYYSDIATETLLTWRGRVEVWQADRPTGYGQTRSERGHPQSHRRPHVAQRGIPSICLFPRRRAVSAEIRHFRRAPVGQ